jgi:hypothetical protein
MGTERTAWHVLLDALFDDWGPKTFAYLAEVRLSSEPLRGDFLLLRRDDAPGLDPTAGTLRRLWALLPKDTLLEFKSVGRPYRTRNLHRLLAYLHVHYGDQAARLLAETDLAGVLLVPARTPSLSADAIALGLWWRDLGGGYSRLERGPFPLYVVEIDVAADADDDDLLRLFGHGAPETREARRWMERQVGSKRAGVPMEDLEEYDDVFEKLLAKASPAQRIAGLTLEQRLLALPDEALRGLSGAYLDTLAEPTRRAISARLDQ